MVFPKLRLHAMEFVLCLMFGPEKLTKKKKKKKNRGEIATFLSSSVVFFWSEIFGFELGLLKVMG